MLPVVRGDAETTKQIVWYSVVMVRSRSRSVSGSAALLGRGGLLGAVFLGMAWQLRRTPTRRNAGVSSTTRSSTWRCFVAAALNPVLL